MYNEILKDLFIDVVEECSGKLWDVTMLGWEIVGNAIEADFRVNIEGRDLKVITKRREL